MDASFKLLCGFFCDKVTVLSSCDEMTLHVLLWAAFICLKFQHIADLVSVR